MIPSLRPHQRKIVDKILPLIGVEKKLLISMPEGSGKGFTLIHILYEYLNQQNRLYTQRILLLVYQKSILNPLKQMINELFQHPNVMTDNIDRIEENIPLFVTTVQALSYLEKYERVDKETFDVVVFLDCENSGISRPDSRVREIADYFTAKTHLALETEVEKSSLYFGPPTIVYTVEDAVRDEIFVRGLIRQPEEFLASPENRKQVDKMVKQMEGDTVFHLQEFEPLIKSILEIAQHEKTVVVCSDERFAIVADYINRVKGEENYAVGSENSYSFHVAQFKKKEDIHILCICLREVAKVDLRMFTQVVLLCDIYSEDKCKQLLEKCMLPYRDKKEFILWDYTNTMEPYFKSLPYYYFQGREASYDEEARYEEAVFYKNSKISLEETSQTDEYIYTKSLVNKDVFDCKAEVLVIPVSLAGDFSESFLYGLRNIYNELQIDDIFPGIHELGEIEVHRINGHSYLRFIIFACTVDRDHSSYGAIREIGEQLAAFAYDNKVDRIAVPLLGTGAGELIPEISYQVLVTSFYKTPLVYGHLRVCIPDPEIYSRVEKRTPDMHGFPEPGILFDNELLEALQLPHIKKLLYSEEFYYELALQKFKEFRDHSAPTNFYSKLSEQFARSKQLYSKFLSEFVGTKEYSFLQLCGQLIAYIDYNAYLKNVWNEYPDKRVIAYSNVRQRSWLRNLLLYKQAGNNPHSIHANNIRNALLYFYEPENTLSMLSENHRKAVVEKLASRNYQSQTANQDIFSLFKEKKIYCRNPLNNGVLYTLLLYAPTIKPLWLEDSSATDPIGEVTRKLKNEDDAEGIEYATLLVHQCLMSGDPELDLGNCGIRDFSAIPELAECVHLKTLILSNEWAEYDEKEQRWVQYSSANIAPENHLRSLPPQVSELINLETLVCGGDWQGSDNWEIFGKWEIEDISVISKLSKLQYLNLSNNAISSLRPLKKLRSLRILHLNNNQIVNITPLKELYRLEELYLSNNLIEDIQHLAELNALHTLDLHANLIRDLFPLKTLFEKIEVSNTKWRRNAINVARNPLEKPPMQIIETGNKRILQYFEDLRPENYINKEIKVVLVGNSEVGKTTLAKYLNNKQELDAPHSATHWMQEIEVSSKYKVKDVCEGCGFHLFDFGGHDYFHDTHHMFYTHNTLYILLWDKDTNHLQLRNTWQKDHTGEIVDVQTQDYPIEYWLESVQFYIKDKEADNFAFKLPHTSSYNSYVLVVQNKAYPKENVVHLNNQELYRKYPFIYEFMHMSIINEEHNMLHFDTVMEEMLNTMPIIGAILPPYYGVVKSYISHAYLGKPILSMQEFNTYCNTLPVEEKINMEQSNGLAEYLRQIGVILLNDRNHEKVYIGKKWIIENIYNVLKGVKKKKGEFDFEHVRERIDSHSPKDAKDILNIMEDFNLIFQHPYRADRYIAPLYLPLMPDNIVELFLQKDPVPYRRLEYGGFIHKQVILNFFHDYGRHIWGEIGEAGSYYYYWKDGLILKDPDTENMVMILFHIGNKTEGNACIDIFEVRGKSKDKRFINNIVVYLKELNKDYCIEEMVTLDGKDFISLELLRENARNGKLIFTKQRREESDKDLEEKKYYKLKDYKEFLMDEGIKRKKVVVSYSKKDLSHLHLLKRYLRPLVDMELIEEPWNCTHNLTASQEWNPEIQQHFEEADVVIFLVSENFYATRYIVDHEIPNTINRYDRDKSVKIVPIILEFYDWGRKDPYNLKRFTALPYQAKPISDFNNPKMAWYTVAESIKMMLEKDLDPGNIIEMSREIQDIYERQVSGRLDRNSL